jgi:hypothetical protein
MQTMTADEFRRLALSLPEAVEASHFDHPDFRVRNKIFATLGYPDSGHGMVKLTPNQQKLVVREAPDAFVALKGGWGKRGATQVVLRHAKKPIVRKALAAAWANTAPKSLVRAHGTLY